MGWDAITLALCDGSSIDATFNSNHVLEKVWGEWERRQQNRLPKDLFDLLQLNASDMSKFDVARKKILLTHFHKQTKSMKVFEDEMVLPVIPHAQHSFPSLLSTSEKGRAVCMKRKR